MSLFITSIPYSWKQLHVFITVLIRFFFSDRNIFIFSFYIFHSAFIKCCITRPVRIFFWLSYIMWAIDQWCTSVLLAAEIRGKAHGVIYIAHINSRVGIGAN